MCSFNILFLLVTLCNLSWEEVTTEQPIRCDINSRKESCPDGYCCARDEFLPEYVICKPIGKKGSSCATVPEESVCPCDNGLKCVPNVNSATFVSIYGTCQSSVTTTIPTTTVITTTASSTQAATKMPRNHPPLIFLNDRVVTILKDSPLGQTVTSFTVKDIDDGANGVVSCSVIQPQFFKIQKTDDHNFNIDVAMPLQSLTTQTILTLVLCEDGGSPPLNGVAQLQIQIVLEKSVTKTTTVATTSTSKTKETTIVPTEDVGKTEKSSEIPKDQTQITQTSTDSQSLYLETTTKRLLQSVTFN